MQSRACWALAAATFAGLALASHRAEGDESAPAVPAPVAEDAREDVVGDDRAAVAFRQALRQHAAGDLQGARASMLESYRLSNRAELLYNIAKIEAALGECAPALAAYRDYLARVPEGRYRAAALQASEQLEAQCPSGRASVVPVSTPVAPEMPVPATTVPGASARPQSTGGSSAPGDQTKHDALAGSNRATTVRWIGWSAVAAGSLAAGGAVYFTLAAIDAHDRFRANVDAAFKTGTKLDRGIQDEQHTDQRWAKILGVTGGALVVGGTLALLFGPQPALPAGARIDLQLLPGSLAASYASTF